MSDNGDFYIGNTKYSATSGTQVTFDVPIPTVAGQDASSNNVVFDEVIVNRVYSLLVVRPTRFYHSLMVLLSSPSP